ncbi:unnamed protein product [Ambrosiozyma monospora]|uniref:Unnamed protein product n=1 Tax=Ambrosiozyma monospora TaxID=43982 RepID=A0ACB5SXT9_AMBMO|nr:unnamed protein product [Ambrosiozyma monospora]
MLLISIVVYEMSKRIEKENETKTVDNGRCFEFQKLGNHRAFYTENPDQLILFHDPSQLASQRQESDTVEGSRKKCRSCRNQECPASAMACGGTIKYGLFVWGLPQSPMGKDEPPLTLAFRTMQPSKFFVVIGYVVQCTVLLLRTAWNFMTRRKHGSPDSRNSPQVKVYRLFQPASSNFEGVKDPCSDEGQILVRIQKSETDTTL